MLPRELLGFVSAPSSTHVVGHAAALMRLLNPVVRANGVHRLCTSVFGTRLVIVRKFNPRA